MKLLQTTVSIARANTDVDIGDARFDVLVARLVDLAAAAGRDRRSAIARLINELTAIGTDLDFAVGETLRRSRLP